MHSWTSFTIFTHRVYQVQQFLQGRFPKKNGSPFRAKSRAYGHVPGLLDLQGQLLLGIATWKSSAVGWFGMISMSLPNLPMAVWCSMSSLLKLFCMTVAICRMEFNHSQLLPLPETAFTLYHGVPRLLWWRPVAELSEAVYCLYTHSLCSHSTSAGTGRKFPISWDQTRSVASGHSIDGQPKGPTTLILQSVSFSHLCNRKGQSEQKSVYHYHWWTMITFNAWPFWIVGW